MDTRRFAVITFILAILHHIIWKLKIIKESAISEASFSTLVIHHFRPLPAATTYPGSPSTPVRVIRKAKHRIGYIPQWTLTCPWLYSKSEKNENETFSQAMFCHLCEKHQIKARNSSGIWATEGCRTLWLDKVVNHETSEQHHETLRLESVVSLILKHPSMSLSTRKNSVLPLLPWDVFISSSSTTFPKQRFSKNSSTSPQTN